MMLKLLLTLVVVGMAVGVDFRTIVEYLEEDGRFTIFSELLRNSSMTIVLQAPGAIYTILAPVDEAFNRSNQDILQEIEEDPVALQRVLMDHIIQNNFVSNQMFNELIQPTLGGAPLRFNIYNETVTADGAVILESDIVLRNGVVHVIDNVILPPQGDILRQVLLDDAEFEDLTAALAVTNLLEDLELEHITLFAPYNSAFQSHFSSTSLPSNGTEVQDFLLNHIVNGTYYPGGLADGSKLTSLSGHTLNINKTIPGEVYVNNQKVDGYISATNGFVFKMTGVLDPTEVADD